MNDHEKEIIEKGKLVQGNSFTDKDELYVGVDVHKEQYHVAIWHNGHIGCVYSMLSDNIKLFRDL